MAAEHDSSSASLEYSTLRLFLLTISSILLLALTKLLWNLVQWRLRISRFRSQGLPMPPWNPILGHLPIAAKISFGLPVNANPQYLPDQIRRLYPDLGPNYYVDLYPMAPSMLVLGTTETLYQITQEHSLPKFPNLREFLKPLTDGLDIVTMEGETWKKWRKLFNPGFSAAHLMTLVPMMVKETKTFIKLLGEHQKAGDVVLMKGLTDNLTMDIIGRVVMDFDFNCQRVPNRFTDGLRAQVLWLSFGAEPNLFDRYNPLRPLVHWFYSRQLNTFVSQEVDKRYWILHSDNQEKQKTRTIMDLTLQSYITETQSDTSKPLDPFFKRLCMSQVKLFLFSGHDTTSSSVCYHLYLLSIYPKVLAEVKAEHDRVFTKDVSVAAELISQDPTLLNKLPYTTAVIKESMRLFPAASSTRIGEPGFFVKDELGRQFPTKDFLVWSCAQSIHRDPALWPRPQEFLPERWLVDSDNPLYPIKGAWRSFEHGPRNCIGQELAMLEMKIILCLYCRAYSLQDCYADIDAKRSGPRPTVAGERAFQDHRSQPDGDLPCRIIKVSAA